MYKASPEFTQQLKTFDNKLFTKWNGKYCRWEIWRKCSIGEKRVMFLEGEGGTYQPLDNRVFATLSLMDFQKRGVAAVLSDVDRYSEETKRDALRAVKDQRKEALGRLKRNAAKETFHENFYGTSPWHGRKSRGLWSQRWPNEVSA